MSEQLILRGLLRHLDEYAPSPPIDRAYPNRRYVPQDDVPYLRVMHLPGPTTRVGASGDTSLSFVGSLSVVVSWPSNQGPEQPQGVVDELRDHFSVDTRLFEGGVRINFVQPASAAAPIPDHPRYEIPITIPYVAYVGAA